MNRTSMRARSMTVSTGSPLYSLWKLTGPSKFISVKVLTAVSQSTKPCPIRTTRVPPPGGRIISLNDITARWSFTMSSAMSIGSPTIERCPGSANTPTCCGSNPLTRFITAEEFSPIEVPEWLWRQVRTPCFAERAWNPSRAPRISSTSAQYPPSSCDQCQ